MKSRTLSESAAPFARLTEPSDMAYVIAAEVEHKLNQDYGIVDLPLRIMARVVDTHIAAFNRRYLAMENALSACSQTAIMNGASKEEMSRIGQMVAEGDSE